MSGNVAGQAPYDLVRPMLSLQKWMRREMALAIPIWAVVVMFLGMSPLGAAIPMLFNGQFAMIALLVVIAILSAQPLLFHRRNLPEGVLKRSKVIEVMLRRSILGQLGSAQEVLDKAAGDLEQIEVLVGQGSFDRHLRFELTREANRRMRRIFDLCCEVPGKLGLSAEGAREQMDRDLEWLGRARRLVEDSTTLPVESSQDSVLEDLEMQAAARQAALRELLGDGSVAEPARLRA